MRMCMYICMYTHARSTLQRARLCQRPGPSMRTRTEFFSGDETDNFFLFQTSRSQRTWCPNTRLATCTCRLHCESKGKGRYIRTCALAQRRAG